MKKNNRKSVENEANRIVNQISNNFDKLAVNIINEIEKIASKKLCLKTVYKCIKNTAENIFIDSENIIRNVSKETEKISSNIRRWFKK